MCRARGYRCVIVMPNNQSDEKVSLLRTLGAEVELVAPAPFADQNNYYHRARVRAEEHGGFWANQFENTANARAHVESTGPEIWAQTGGKLDGFVCSSGTGGTVGGVSHYLKSKSASVHCAVVDCGGSSLYAHVTAGTLDVEGGSLPRGHRHPPHHGELRDGKLDGAFRGSDAEATEMVHWLLAARTACSSAAAPALNCVGAVRLAKKLGPGNVIATILADGARPLAEPTVQRSVAARSKHVQPRRRRELGAPRLSLKDLTARIVESYRQSGGVNHVNGISLPSRPAVAEILVQIEELCFRGSSSTRASPTTTSSS